LIKNNPYICGTLGVIVGLIFPIFLVVSDLQELGMAFNFENFKWVVTSQNAILFSFFGVPIVFFIIAVLISLFLKRNAELILAQQAMTKMAHAAGMAEIASEVIHNIGNILTGIFIHTDSIKMTIEDSKYKSITKAKSKLDTKKELLDEIYKTDPEFEKLINYFIIYGENTVNEYDEVEEAVDELKKSIYTIRDILIAQQTVACSGAFIEEVTLKSIIDNALQLLNDKLEKHEVDITIDVNENLLVHTEKSKVVNILCNLIKNAYEAMEDKEDKKINIRVDIHDTTCTLAIIDNGLGMDKDELKEIFKYGYSTKDRGSGFGLHSCLNLAKSIDGELTAESRGKGQGSSFIIKLPFDKSIQGKKPSEPINFS